MVSHATHSPCSFPPANVPAALLPLIRGGGGYLLPANVLHIGNSYTQLWEINNQALGSGRDMAVLVNAIATAVGSDVSGAGYWQSGASFSSNYGTPACLTKIASEAWTHAVMQDLSNGPTGGGLAAHIQYGNLLAEEFWETNPGCRIILRETPAYQAGHSSYPGTFDDPDDMIAQVSAGYEACRDNINTLHPDKYPAAIVKCGTLIWALGGNLPLDHPSFRHFHDEINDDHTHVNPERAWLEAAMIYVHLTGRNPSAYMATAVAAVVALDADFNLTHETAPQIGTWAYRYVRAGAYPCLFVQHPADTTVEPGADAVFTVDVRTTGAVSYQWYRDGAILTEETSPTLSLSAVVEGDDGAEFKVVATNSEGSVESATAILTVAAIPAMVPVYINFARIATATPAPASDGWYWNDWNEDGDTTLPNVGVAKSLVDRTNAASGLTIEVTANVGGFGFELASSGILGLPATVTSTMWCTQNGGSGTFTVRVNNLTPGTTYRFHVGGFRGSGSTRTTRITATGATTAFVDYDAGINLTSLPYIDMVADGSGRVSFLCDDSTPTSLAIGYLGLMQISNPP